MHTQTYSYAHTHTHTYKHTHTRVQTHVVHLALYGDPAVFLSIVLGNFISSDLPLVSRALIHR
jgi:hypothetical protein